MGFNWFRPEHPGWRKYGAFEGSDDQKADAIARAVFKMHNSRDVTGSEDDSKRLRALQRMAKGRLGEFEDPDQLFGSVLKNFSKTAGFTTTAGAAPLVKAEGRQSPPQDLAAADRAKRKAGLAAALDRYQSDLDARMVSTESEYGRLIGDTGVSYDSHIKGLNTIQNPYTTAAMNEQRGQAMRGMNTALEQSKGSLASRGLLGGAAEGAMAAGVAGQYAVNDANLVQQGALSRADWQQQQAGKLAELSAARQSALGGLTSQRAQAMQGLVGARNQFGINRGELLQNEENYANDAAYKQGLLGIQQGQLGLQQAEFQDKQAQADYARRTEEEQAPWRFATNAGQMLLGTAGLVTSMTPFGAPFAPILTPISAGLINSGIQGFTKTPIAGGGLPYEPKAYEGARGVFQTAPQSGQPSQRLGVKPYDGNFERDFNDFSSSGGLDSRPMPKGAMWGNKDLYSYGSNKMPEMDPVALRFGGAYREPNLESREPGYEGNYGLLGAQRKNIMNPRPTSGSLGFPRDPYSQRGRR